MVPRFWDVEPSPDLREVGGELQRHGVIALPSVESGQVAPGRERVQGMLWQTSPACTELEQHVRDWLAALHRASGGQVVRNGIGRGRYVVYTFTAANFGRCRWSVGSGR